MAIRDRVAGLFGIKQASAVIPAETPMPRVEDSLSVTVGDGHDYSSIRQILQSEPTKVEYLFAASTEWANTIARLRIEVWRRGVHVVPAYDRYCVLCGQGSDGEVRDVGDPVPPGEPLQCENCGGIEFRDPDPAAKKRLEDFLDSCNDEYESVALVGSRKVEEQLKYGRGLVVFAFDYFPSANAAKKTIDKMVLRGVYAADPGKIARVRKPTGRTGGLFVCVWCRSTDGYKAAKAPGDCECGAPLYEAWYEEQLGRQKHYYLRNEVHETRWPFMDGSSPVTRLWTKANTLILMDWYAGAAVDPRRPKRPDKLFVTVGGDESSMEKWAKRDAEQAQKNPNKLRHLHIPAAPGGLKDLEMSAFVLDFGDKEFRGQMMDLRQDFADSVRKFYFISQVQGGDSEGTGGLNNESQQLRSTGDVTEDLKEHEEDWLDKIPAYLGTDEWRVEFMADEDTSGDAETVLKQLEVAEKAAGLGLNVQWIGDTAHIKDGPVEKPAAPMFPPMGSEAFQQALGAPSSSAGVPGNVEAVFSGPSGYPLAEEAIYATYAGLTAEESARVREEVAKSLTQPQGWSIDSVGARVLPILTGAGIDPVTAAWRARVIAATETRAAISEWQHRLFRAEEADRGKEFLYRDVGPDDARTTKQSYWVRQQVGEGKTLREITQILDEAVRLAASGAFAEGGSLAGGPGQPVKLPSGFQRRGFLVAFGDRDRIIRAGPA